MLRGIKATESGKLKILPLATIFATFAYLQMEQLIID